MQILETRLKQLDTIWGRKVVYCKVLQRVGAHLQEAITQTALRIQDPMKGWLGWKHTRSCACVSSALTQKMLTVWSVTFPVPRHLLPSLWSLGWPANKQRATAPHRDFHFLHYSATWGSLPIREIEQYKEVCSCHHRCLSLGNLVCISSQRNGRKFLYNLGCLFTPNLSLDWKWA